MQTSYYEDVGVKIISLNSYDYRFSSHDFYSEYIPSPRILLILIQLTQFTVTIP